MIVPLTTFIAVALILPAQLSAQQRGQTGCEVLNGGLGSVDYDKDGIENCKDNCVLDANPKQTDRNRNGIGDACEWRERQRRRWEESGRKRRRKALESVDLSKLIAKSSDVVLGRLNGFSWVEKDGGVAEVEIIHRFKDSTDQSQQQYVRPLWVFVPRGGPPELVGDLLLFLKNGKAGEWRKPAIWSEPLRAGTAPEGLKYFRYELADVKYGVLGVSQKRLIEIRKIIDAQHSYRDPTKPCSGRRASMFLKHASQVIFSFSLNVDRSPQLKAISVRHPLSNREQAHETKRT